MKWINYLIGIAGFLSLAASLAFHYMPREKIKMKEGSYYYHEASGGYGFFTEVNPSGGDPFSSIPRFRFVLLEDAFVSTDSFFAPVAVDAGEDSAIIRVGFDHQSKHKALLSVYHSKNNRDYPYAAITGKKKTNPESEGRAQQRVAGLGRVQENSH